MWYFLAILTAVSLASAPPDTKKTLESLSGATEAILADNFAVGGLTAPMGVKLTCFICS